MEPRQWWQCCQVTVEERGNTRGKRNRGKFNLETPMEYKDTEFSWFRGCSAVWSTKKCSRFLTLWGGSWCGKPSCEITLELAPVRSRYIIANIVTLFRSTPTMWPRVHLAEHDWKRHRIVSRRIQVIGMEESVIYFPFGSGGSNQLKRVVKSNRWMWLYLGTMS